MTIRDTQLKFKGDPGLRRSTLGLVVHHSANASATDTAKSINEYHQNNNGWIGIGYHYVIMPDGVVERGRPEHWIGAHCPGVNSTHIGVCLSGRFDDRRQPTRAQLEALAELWALLSDRYGWSKRDESLSGHRDHYATECPGQNLYDKLPEIRKMGREGTTSIVDIEGLGKFSYKMIDDKSYISVRDLAATMTMSIDTTGWPHIRLFRE